MQLPSGRVLMGIGIPGFIMSVLTDAVKHADVVPEAITKNIDTMAREAPYTAIQRKMASLPGTRVKIRGIMDQNTDESMLKMLSGEHEFNDMREIIDDSLLDDILSR